MKEESKIRLLVFTPTLQCGGSEKFVSLLCNHINTQKFEVCLAVLDNAAPFYKITNPAIELVDLKAGRVRHSLFKIKKLVKAYQPDIIFSIANHLNLYFAIFRNWFPGQVKFIARESSIVSINSRRASFPKLYNLLVKKYFRRFDHIICQGIYMQQDLLVHYNITERQTTVINNATAAAFNNKQEKKEGDGVYTFITVTRLSEEKGVERLIHAVGLLSVPFKYYIVGGGPQQDHLQKLVNELQLQEKVFLTGEKEAPFHGMEAADLFLMGSYYEGFPNVLLEAGSFGIPVVAFNAPGGIEEIIIEGDNGLLVEDNDILGFAATVNRSLSRNFDRNKIIEMTQKRFGIDAMMKKMENLLLEL